LKPAGLGDETISNELQFDYWN